MCAINQNSNRIAHFLGETARAVCEARLGELPAIYAVADVCRPDLLVEIEAIAFSFRS